MERKPLSRRSITNRSAVTNGSRVLPGVDGRSTGGRRYRDIVDSLTREVGGALTAAEQLTVRNVATLQMQAEVMTAAMARGEAVDADALTRATNGATRALAALRRLRPAPSRRKMTATDVLAARRMAAE